MGDTMPPMRRYRRGGRRQVVFVDRGLESEAGELAAVYAAIIRNMRIRLEREAEERKNQRARRN